MSTTTATHSITKIIALTLNGFHGFVEHRVRGTFSPSGDADRHGLRWKVIITPAAARKFACKHKDCACGEGMPEEFECDNYDFEHGEITIKGNYPQR